MTTRKKHKKGDEAKPFLPDDTIGNVLSWLPIKDTMMCRFVCKSWRDLTMNHFFVNSHCGNRTPPTILVADPGYNNAGVDVFSLDKWWEPARKRSMFHKFPFHSELLPNTSCALFSHAGLTVFKQNECISSQVIFRILNPTRQEHVRITVAKEIRESQIYGVFFHPELKEYCSLWNIAAAPTNRPKQNPFKMLILGSDPHFKTVKNLSGHNFLLLSRRDYPVVFIYKYLYPVFIDEYLYWMFRLEQDNPYNYARQDIVEFSIIKEEIRVMSCPSVIFGANSTLLNIDGTLSCLTINSTNVTIWRMEHHTVWTSSVYHLDLRKYCLYARPIAVVEGKLVLTFDRRLLVCNLMEGTVKNCQNKRYRQKVDFLSHQMTLASLKKCKRTMFIDQDGQLVVSQIA